MSPLPTAKESTVQPSNSFVMSKFNVKQTKAQVFESSNSSTSTMASSNYSMIKPTQMNKDQLMLDEYMSRLNQMEMDKKLMLISCSRQLRAMKQESFSLATVDKL